MLADHSKDGSGFVELEQESRGTAIRDPEIAQIAVFKLRECAARLQILAGTAQESPLRKELREIGDQLLRMEVNLLRHIRDEHDVPG